jgi:hypothetical protein
MTMEEGLELVQRVQFTSKCVCVCVCMRMCLRGCDDHPHISTQSRMYLLYVCVCMCVWVVVVCLSRSFSALQCIAEVNTRTVINTPQFFIKVADKDGVRAVEMPAAAAAAKADE